MEDQAIIAQYRLRSITLAIASVPTHRSVDYVDVDGAVVVLARPVPAMCASAKCLRRWLARTPSKAGDARAARRVSEADVAALARKRTEATRLAAIQAYARTGSLPAPRVRKRKV